MKPPRKTPEKAAALKYDGKNAPTLVAKGSGATAREIIALAEKNKVFLHKDPLLSEVLSHLELGDEIPEQLYLAVAKIIAFAYFLQGKHPDYQSPQVQTDQVLLRDKVDDAGATAGAGKTGQDKKHVQVDSAPAENQQAR